MRGNLLSYYWFPSRTQPLSRGYDSGEKGARVHVGFAYGRTLVCLFLRSQLTCRVTHDKTSNSTSGKVHTQLGEHAIKREEIT